MPGAPLGDLDDLVLNAWFGATLEIGESRGVRRKRPVMGLVHVRRAGIAFGSWEPVRLPLFLSTRRRNGTDDEWHGSNPRQSPCRVWHRLVPQWSAGRQGTWRDSPG